MLSVAGLPHDDFLALVPIPLEREVGVNRIPSVLPRDGEQHAGGAHDRVGQFELNGRLDAASNDKPRVKRVAFLNVISIRAPYSVDRIDNGRISRYQIVVAT